MKSIRKKDMIKKNKLPLEVYLLFMIINLLTQSIPIHIEIIKKLNEKYSLLTLIA